MTSLPTQDPGTDLSQITETEILVSSETPIVSHSSSESSSQDIENFFDTHTDTQTTVKHILSQTTSIPQTSTINYIGDFNVSAYMRKQRIDIVSYNLRPNRRIFPYFDEKSVSNIFERANVIEVDNDAEFIGVLPKTASTLPVTNIDDNGNIIGQIDSSSERIYTSTGSAKVFFTEKTTEGRTRIYIDSFRSNVQNANSVLYGTGYVPDTTYPNVRIITGAVYANGFAVGDTIIGTKSGSRANIVSYTHNSGILTGPSVTININDVANTYGLINISYNKVQVTLSKEASDINDFYVGQTLTLLTGDNPGESAKIISYDGNTKSCIISPPFTGMNNAEEMIYSLSDPRDVYDDTFGNNSIYTSSTGTLAGRLYLPSPAKSPYFRWRTGEKLLKISDSPSNRSDDATTIAEYIYNSFGLSIARGQTIINYFNDKSVTPSFSSGESTPVPIPLSPPLVTGTEIIANAQQLLAASEPVIIRRYNPIAQSFFVSEVEYPKGFFVPYIDLFFAKKGTLPVSLEIRPLINGFPDSKNIVPGAVAVVPAEDVKVSAFPNTSNSMTYTRFTFNSPVYLLPGADYVMTIGSNDYDYEIYVSELGERVIGSDRKVSQQPYLGNLFKSQNSSNYDAIQSEDMMFVIHKCQFVTSGSVVFHEEKIPDLYNIGSFGKYFRSNTRVDCFEVQSDVIEVPGTDVSYYYKATTDSTNTLDSDFVSFKPDKRIVLNSRKVVKDKSIDVESFLMQVDMTTTDRNISPIIYKEKQNLYTAATIINNMGLNTRGVRVANTGNSYTHANTSVIISANSGSGANAMIITQFQDYSEGIIETLYFDQAGSGYYDNVEISLVRAGVANAANAVINYNSETDPSGGPAVARYISKIVTLAPEFEAGDLKVFLTAIKPVEADIQVYYKIKNAYDEEAIDAKRWIRMARKTGINMDTIGFTPMEYEYSPSLSSNNIVYSSNTATFNTFNQFKIKIVLASSDTSLNKIPYVYDMRAIAIPGDPE